MQPPARGSICDLQEEQNILAPVQRGFFVLWITCRSFGTVALAPPTGSDVEVASSAPTSSNSAPLRRGFFFVARAHDATKSTASDFTNLSDDFAISGASPQPLGRALAI
jgi:hypothetical protein